MTYANEFRMAYANNQNENLRHIQVQNGICQYKGNNAFSKFSDLQSARFLEPKSRQKIQLTNFSALFLDFVSKNALNTGPPKKQKQKNPLKNLGKKFYKKNFQKFHEKIFQNFIKKFSKISSKISQTIFSKISSKILRW